MSSRYTEVRTMSKAPKKGFLPRLLKLLFGYVPRLLPLTMVFILLSAAASAIAALFVQMVIAAIEV